MKELKFFNVCFPSYCSLLLRYKMQLLIYICVCFYLKQGQHFDITLKSIMYSVGIEPAVNLCFDSESLGELNPPKSYYVFLVYSGLRSKLFKRIENGLILKLIIF